MLRFAASLVLVGAAVASCTAPRDAAPLELPDVGASDYYWIASRIYENETRGQPKYLTYWGEGEDFPSLGIGHFIWFPEGVDAPFDESFPTMVAYVREQASDCSPLPDWLQKLEGFDAPWSDKTEFDEQQQSERMIALREWLAATAPEQVQFIVTSFHDRWNDLDLSARDKDPLTAVLQRLLQTSQGMFAVVDYYNFKGIGSNWRERYRGDGWGLVQVLGDIAEAPIIDDADLVMRFSEAAAQRLQLRIRNSPPERGEARWTEGWNKRVAAYNETAPQLAGPAASPYRITPYLQKLSSNSVTISWFGERPTAGRVTIRGGPEASRDDERVLVSASRPACELGYHLAEYRDLLAARLIPYKHQVTVEGLIPGREYRYIALQDGVTATGRFRTPGGPDQNLRFVVYGDSETEPESTGKRALWSSPGGNDADRRYLVDQTTGYAENIELILRREPDFVAIAGDLVESGGEQRDWDEFWTHNARLAASIPIVPALGNHDYYGGPGELGGYTNAATKRAVAKFKTYFDAKSYYSLDYGPVTLIVLDSNNGVPERSDADTNWYLTGEGQGGAAPAWNQSSAQMSWLLEALAAAQSDKQFTFVMFHAPPYSSGIHGKAPGLTDDKNFASGRPLQALTPLFLRYGVDAVFNGHDEIYEHSAVRGIEVQPNDEQVEHTVHFFTVGIGGDGLRGPDPGASNPQRVFLAHDDAPEIYDDNGVLLDGGKHYGHLEVNVGRDVDGQWQARIEPVYVFPVTAADGSIESFERRVYDDVTLLGSARDD